MSEQSTPPKNSPESTSPLPDSKENSQPLLLKQRLVSASLDLTNRKRETVRIMRTTDSLLEEAKMLLGDQLRRLTSVAQEAAASSSTKVRLPSVAELKATALVVDSLKKIAAEERERAKGDKVGDMSDEELLAAIEEIKKQGLSK